MAAGATYEPIATTTLGSAASSITFSSIPSTYTDLRLVLTATTSTTNGVLFRYNGVSTTTYSTTELAGTGASAVSNSFTGNSYLFLDYISSTSTTIPTFYTCDIFSYAGSTYKTCLTTNSGDRNGSGNTEVTVQLWRSTAAITSILLYLQSAGNFNTGTTATLYGIKAA